MKVLFLDIDGVLNNVEYQMNATEPPPFLDKTKLAILKEIVDKTNVKIVLSSSWKKAWQPGCDFDCIFKNAGITISDVTPALGFKRVEISAWLKSHPETEKFVILDDAVAGWGELMPNVVFTDQNKGLQHTDIESLLQKIWKKE